uniref:Uncharacterized protein n=1 Tax=Oryza barthii TaxID=65489 RepID=A0A0D3FJU4_9ORYZ
MSACHVIPLFPLSFFSSFFYFSLRHGSNKKRAAASGDRSGSRRLRHRRPRHRVRQPGLGEDPRARRRHFPRRPRCARRRPHSLGTTISWPQQRSIYGENARDGTPTNPMRPRQCPRRILQWLRRRRRRQPRQPGRRAARHARQEGGAGRGRQHWVRSLQEAADRGRHRARWRGDWRRHGRDGAEQRQTGLEGGNGQPWYTAAVALAFVAASLGKGGWRGGGGGRWVAALFRRGSVERSSLQRVFGDATLRDTVAPLLRLPPPRRLRRDVRRRGHRHSPPPLPPPRPPGACCWGGRRGRHGGRGRARGGRGGCGSSRRGVVPADGEAGRSGAHRRSGGGGGGGRRTPRRGWIRPWRRRSRGGRRRPPCPPAAARSQREVKKS